MDTIYLIFFAIFGLVLAIGVGLQLSSTIDDFVIYVLFWMLYIISLVTFVNIFLTTYYYLNMKNKAGPPGKIGPQGDRGDKGQAGLCDVSCRDSIGENQLLDVVKEKLKEKNKGVEVNFQNAFIKAKIRQMVASEEFRRVAPINGPQNLINYMKDIWKIWIDLLFDAGGVKYFEMIGGEMEFDWIADNPFNELKKYDVFYWGMGRQYRPEIIEKCYKSSDGVTPDLSLESFSFIQASKTNFYESLGVGYNGRNNYVSFWRAKQFTYDGTTYYPVGDLAYGPSGNDDNINMNRYVGAINLSYNVKGPDRGTIIVAGDVKGPRDYLLIWSATNTRNKFYIWRPIPPDGYVSLGDVVTFKNRAPLTGSNAPIRCVPKDVVKKLAAPTNKLWSSIRTGLSSSDINLLGFVPTSAIVGNAGKSTAATDINAYNMFRGVISNTLIPRNEVQDSFYALDPLKYDVNKTIGITAQTPEVPVEDNKVGKGYLKFEPKDSKYSIMTYVNMKNNPILKHSRTNKLLKGQLVPNAISNAYIIQLNNKCISFKNNELKINDACDELKDEQIFSILPTGKQKGEVRIQHYKSDKFLKYMGGEFSLQDKNITSDLLHLNFIMQ